MKRIPHSRPLFGRSEQDAVQRVIASGYLSQGREVEAFELEMASALDRRYAVAVHSGWAALHLALLALGVGAGDRVAIPSYVCSAPLHALTLAGARPLVVDVNPKTFNMDPEDLRRRLRPRTKAIIVPHMFGLPAEMKEIQTMGVPIIEDCALALGAQYHGKPVGSQGVLSVVSFYTTKMLATGEGGMVLGNRDVFLRRVRDLRSYDEKPSHRLRFNYKMTDLQAALGRAQVRRLKSFIRSRRRLASYFMRSLAGGPWDLPSRSPDHVYYRFVIRHRRGPSGIISAVNQQGIEARRPVFKPIHRYLGLEGFPGTEEAHRRAVSVPLYPSLTSKEARRVVKAMWETGRVRKKQT